MLPAEFRDALAQWSPEGRCKLTTQDDCIFAWPWPEWEALRDKLENARAPSRALRDYARKVIGAAEDLELDQQNRLRLSRAHIEYAGLQRDVVLIGLAKRFEIWDAARFRKIQEQDFADLDQELAERGLDIF
jgi:MraZ protein